MNLSRFRNLATYVVTAGIVGLPIFPALWLAATNWGQKLEKSTIDLRYVLSGQRKLSPQIVLVLEDEASQKRFKHLESSRGVIATLINHARANGAKVIAIDFQFVRPHLAYEDSLLLAAVKGKEDVIVGCSYSNLTPPEKPENTVRQNDDSSEYSVAAYPDFLVSPDSMMVMPQLLEAGAKVGHVDVVFDPINGQAATVPLYIKGDKRVAAFGLETIKTYLSISDNEIKIRSGKLMLLPAGHEPLRIPMTQTGEFLLDHLGNEDNFDDLSWSEVYDRASGSRPDSSDWKGKIVLIGSKLEDPEFPTPYATDFFLPGVLIHATVIDNILSERFLRPLPANAHLWLIIVCSLILFWLFSRATPSWQIFSLILMIVLFAGLTFGLFYDLRIILPFTPVVLFIFMTVVLQGTKEWLMSVRSKANLEQKVERLKEDIFELTQRLRQRRPESASFMLFILSSEWLDQTFYLHYLARNSRPDETFWPKIKRPLKVDNTTINKLEYSIRHLHESYVHYVCKGTKEEMTLRERLSKIGARLFDEFGMKQTLGELFAAGGATFPLNVVMSNLKLPWNWAYHAASGQFLCEAFALGISFASERQVISDSTEREPLPSTNASNRAAILFYGDWPGHPGKQLKHVRGQIYELEKKFDGQDCNTAIIHPKNGHFLSHLSNAIAEVHNLRIIHYTGHARHGFLDVGPEDELTASMISETLGLAFSSRPLVFLNACSSGQLPKTWEKMDHLSTEFLACGAGACIVTSFDVYEKTACTFSLHFYDFFIKERKTAGEALKLAIQKLGEPDLSNGYDPDYDLTRYFYQLFGDPAIRF